MFTIFEPDEQRVGLHLISVVDETGPEFPEKQIGITFNYNILDSEITCEEYIEWKLNRPRTADDC